MIAFSPRPSSRLLPTLLSGLLFNFFSLASDIPVVSAAAPLPQAVEGQAAVDRAAETPHPADAAIEDPAIEDRAADRSAFPGPSIEAALAELVRLLSDRPVGEHPLEEVLGEGDPSLAER